MKKIIIFFISLFFYTLLYSQTKSESAEINKNQSEFTSISDTNATILGVWTLKEMRFVKYEDESLNILTDKDKQYQEGKYKPAEQNGKSNKTFYQFRKFLTDNDSVIYRYNSKMKEDSIYAMNFRSDGSFDSGNNTKHQFGKFDRKGDIITLYIDNHNISNKILFVSKKQLVIQNITGSQKYRMFFEN